MFLIGLVVFWAVIYALGRVLHLEKRGFEMGPAYFMFKSKRMKDFVDAVSERRSGFWMTLANVGLVLGFGLMVYSLFFLITNLLKFSQPSGGGTTPIFLLIPGVTLRLFWLPYFLVAGIIIVVTHELAHGISARLDKIPIDSAGVLLFLFFPGAFVEPNEEKFEEAPLLPKLRMLAAGSVTNLVTGLLALLLLTTLFTPAGIVILETSKGGPLEKAGLGPWDVIYGMNGTKIADTTALTKYMANVTVNSTLILETNKGEVSVTAAKGSEGQAIIGLANFLNYFQCRLSLGHIADIYAYLTLSWLLLLGIAIGVFNMLPAFPFDGDKVFYYSLKKVTKRELRGVRMAVSLACFGLMAANLIFSIMKFGLFAL
jgi:membrane-associated protease RseP (regulator of RpoE activity)